MPTVADLVPRVLPTLFLIGLGMGLRRTPVLDESTVAGLKRLIVSVALPAVLFTTFLSTTFQPSHVWVVITVMGICLLLLGLGHGFSRLVLDRWSGSEPGQSSYVPFLFTGFELGMLGFALFTAVYGAGQLPALGVLALGHEVFIWFVYASLLRAAGHRRTAPAQLARELVSSPVVIAIVSGLALNIAGAGAWLRGNVPGAATLATLDQLAGIVVPVVLIVIGYTSRLTWSGVRQALPLVGLRLAVVVPLALFVGEFVFVRTLGLERIFADALLTLMVLPPPFIVPLFIPERRRAEAQYVTNVLSLYSLASVAVFVSYVLVTGS